MIRKLLGFSVFVPLFLAACYQPVTNEAAKYDERRSDPIIASNNDRPEGPDASPPNDAQKEEQMTDSNRIAAVGFRQNVVQNMSRVNLKIEDVVDDSDPVEQRVLAEYGAVFLTKAKPPSKVMFANESDVLEFQNSAGISQASIGGFMIELQPEAMEALQSAIAEAKSGNLSISPRDGTEAGRRSFAKTLELWNSRFEPALRHWISKKRISEDEAARLRSLPMKQQVEAVLELEKRGIYFNTFFNNSILYSVAAPGTSQHLSMLAFDVVEYSDKRIQSLMANHGWFRTVQNDAPHFTYLGYGESELSALGLKKVQKSGGYFWIPDV